MQGQKGTVSLTRSRDQFILASIVDEKNYVVFCKKDTVQRSRGCSLKKFGGASSSVVLTF